MKIFREESKKKPLFSIITATFNSEKVLQHCIDSVKSQLYRDFEHIIIDGKSSDNTIKLIKDNEDIIEKWISEKDSGVYDAWNKGVNMASGEWLLFLGSDDILYPEALLNYAKLINDLSFQSDVEFISSKIHLVNSKGKIYRTFGKPFKWSEFKRSVKIAHTGSIHKNTLFKKYGYFNTDYKICGDYEFLLRPGSNLKTKYIDFVAAAMSDGGISNNRSKVFKEHYKAVTQTGGLNKFVAIYDYFLLNIKVLIRKVLN